MGRYLDLVKKTPLPGTEAPPWKAQDPVQGGTPSLETLVSPTPLPPRDTTKTTETTKAPPTTALDPDDPEIAWRLKAMRKQVPLAGAIPDLIAREAPTQPGTCFSCG